MLTIQGERNIPSARLDRISELIEPWFMFALVWTVGGTCDNNGREKFDKFVRIMFAESKVDTFHIVSLYLCVVKICLFMMIL